MKISIRASLQSTWRATQHPLKWAFEEGSALGFDGLEVCLDAGFTGSFVRFWTEDLIEGARALSAQYRMPIYSLSENWGWNYDCFFPDLKDWGRATEYMAADARLASRLGAHTILVQLGRAKGSWDDCKAILTEVAKAGEEHKVRFGYEANIWELLGFGGLEALCRMVDEIASPWFGVYLHNAYPRTGLPLHEEVEIAGERLVQAMHSSSLVADAPRAPQIDFEKAFAAMREHFADGAYTFEVPWEEAEQNRKLIQDMVAKYW